MKLKEISTYAQYGYTGAAPFTGNGNFTLGAEGIHIETSTFWGLQ